MYVDGGHFFDIALSDIRNFARVASQPHNVIVADDLHIRGVRRAWNTAVRSGIVQHLFSCGYSGKHGKAFAVGVVRQQKSY